jgi:excisionase family DNA binding protein
VEPLLTIKDLVAILRLSKSKVYQLKDAGLLTPVKLPGCSKVLFDRAEVRRFLAGDRAVTAPASTH